MSLLIMTAVLIALVLYLGIAWMVVKKYRQSGNLGFLILGCGVLLWPIFSSLLVIAFNRLVPFSALSDAEITRGDAMAMLVYAYQITRESLILLGLVLIGRSLNRLQPRTADTAR